MFSKPCALHLTAGSAVFLESCNLWLGLCWGSENCFPCQQCCLLSSSETGEPGRFSLTCQNVLTKVHKRKLKTHGCCCLCGLRLMHFSWSYESKTPLFQAAVCSLLGKFSVGVLPICSIPVLFWGNRQCWCMTFDPFSLIPTRCSVKAYA